MSAYRELMKTKNPAEELGPLEFVLFTSGTVNGPSPLLSEACTELAGLQAVEDAAIKLLQAAPMIGNKYADKLQDALNALAKSRE